jgi:hypothetical protein
VPAIVVKAVERLVDMMASACRRTARVSERKSESCSAFWGRRRILLMDQRRCVEPRAWLLRPGTEEPRDGKWRPVSYRESTFAVMEVRVEPVAYSPPCRAVAEYLGGSTGVSRHTAVQMRGRRRDKDNAMALYWAASVDFRPNKNKTMAKKWAIEFRKFLGW